MSLLLANAKLAIHELSIAMDFPLEILPLYVDSNTEAVAYISTDGLFLSSRVLDSVHDIKVYVAHEIFHWVVNPYSVLHSFPHLVCNYATDYKINELLYKLFSFDVRKVKYPGLFSKKLFGLPLRTICKKLIKDWPEGRVCSAEGLPHPVIASCAAHLRKLYANHLEVSRDPFALNDEQLGVFESAYRLVKRDKSYTLDIQLDKYLLLKAFWAALYLEKPQSLVQPEQQLSWEQIVAYSVPYDSLRNYTVSDPDAAMFAAIKLLKSIGYDSDYLSNKILRARNRIRTLTSKPFTKTKRYRKLSQALAAANASLARAMALKPLRILMQEPVVVVSTTRKMVQPKSLAEANLEVDEEWLPKIRNTLATRRIEILATYTADGIEEAFELRNDLNDAFGNELASEDLQPKTKVGGKLAAPPPKPKVESGSESESGAGDGQGSDSDDAPPSNSGTGKGESGSARESESDSDLGGGKEAGSARGKAKPIDQLDEIGDDEEESELSDVKHHVAKQMERYDKKLGVDPVTPTTEREHQMSTLNLSYEAETRLADILTAFNEIDTMLQKMRSRTRDIADEGPDSLFEYGNDAQRAVAEDIALLANPETELLFLSRLASHQLLMTSPQKPSRASCIIAVDCSGSMKGSAYARVAGFTLAMAKWMHRERRGFGFILFDTDVVHEYYVDKGEALNMMLMLKMIMSPSYGGTSFDMVLVRAFMMRKRMKWDKCNVMLLSDGYDNVSLTDTINSMKGPNGKLVSVLTNKKSLASLAAVTDEQHHIRTLGNSFDLVRVSASLLR